MRQKVIEYLKRTYSGDIFPPSKAKYQAGLGKPCSIYCIPRIFGSWTEALKAAGFSPRQPGIPRETHLCLQCGKLTKNPKFCSRSCAATYNNRLFPKRKPQSTCIDCGQPCTKQGKFCRSCWTKRKDNELYTNMTYSSLGKEQGLRKYQKNSKIRNAARKVYKRSGKSMRCKVCGYDKHTHVCHIKPIHTFDRNTLISVINDLDNLVALCPNCHWELDHGKLTLV